MLSRWVLHKLPTALHNFDDIHEAFTLMHCHQPSVLLPGVNLTERATG